MVPNGWNRTTLGEIAEFKNGLNFTKSDKGEAIKIVGVGDFKDFAELRSTDLLETIYVNNRVRDEELLEDGDLLFVRSNGNKDLIGRCLFFPTVATRLSYSGFTIRGRVNKDLALPEYISSVARSSLMKQQISKNGGGTNISNLSQQILNDVVFLLPPLPEQKKIARILSTWDKTITTTEQLLTNSQQQKKALMQQLLTGKKRLLDKNGVRFSGEWESNHLKKLLQISKGNQLNKDTLSKSGEYAVINGGIEPSGYTNEYNTEANTITISEGGNSCGFVGFQSTRFWCGGHCYAIKNLKIDLNFTYQLLKFNQSKIMRLRVGSGLPNIQKKDLESLSVEHPISREEQQKIAAVLSTADQEISGLQQKLDALKQEKKALMQQLLTGKRRVTVN